MASIVKTNGVLGSESRLEGHRITVIQVADMVLQGEQSPEYVGDQLDISLAEVYATLSYYYEHPDEMNSILERHQKLEEQLKSVCTTPSTPEQ